MHTLKTCAVALLVGCSQPQPQDPTGTTTGSTTTGTPLTGTPTTGTTDSTIPVPEFDCATVPMEATEWRRIEEARGYHDVAFTDDGWMIGANEWNQNLVMADGLGGADVFYNGTGMVQGLEWLPDGRLGVASDWPAAIHAIDPVTRERELLIPGIGPYAIIMGPDGKLWSADGTSVRRHDLTTRSSEMLVPSLGGSYGIGGARAIGFDPDHTRLYIGTFGGNGNLYVVDLDPTTYTPDLATLRVFATGVGDGSYHDAVGVDVCGYLYVPDYSTSALYKISPSGQIVHVYNVPRDLYGHGVEWGNGVGEWREDAIYMPLPYGGNRVVELVIGVPKTFEGNVINRPSR